MAIFATSNIKISPLEGHLTSARKFTRSARKFKLA